MRNGAELRRFLKSLPRPAAEVLNLLARRPHNSMNISTRSIRALLWAQSSMSLLLVANCTRVLPSRVGCAGLLDFLPPSFCC
jgi:hypothetical protein